MDAASAKCNINLQTQTPPHEIYRPLSEIAQFGYDADDVKEWYIMMLRHFRRMGVENAVAAYSLNTPSSNPSPTQLDLQAQQATDAALYVQERSNSLPYTKTSANTSPAAWSQAYSPASYPGTMEPTSHFSNALQDYNLSAQQPFYQGALTSPTWAPTAGVAQGPDAHDYFAAASGAPDPVNLPALSTGWYSPDDFNALHGVSWNTGGTPTTGYQMTVSNTAMPILVPTDPTPRRRSAMSIPSSPGHPAQSTSYHPPTQVTSANQRRARIQKGVKRIMNPLHYPSQSI